MRIESSITSVSWIPPAAITGLPRVFFEHGLTHYDAPPPQEWTDLDSVLGPQGARFAHDLRAWIEVHDGKITAFGQDGGLHLNSTMVRLGGKHIAVEGVGYPELRQDPVVGPASSGSPRPPGDGPASTHRGTSTLRPLRRSSRPPSGRP